MASKPKPENSRFAPFIPALELSREDANALSREAQALVARAVDEYQYYRSGAADWTMWKEVRRVDTLRVFRERQSITKNDIDSAGAPLLPEVLAIGNVSGAVDDMLFGAMAPTATAMLATARCTDAPLSEARVMATLVAPTPRDPFRSLTAKWCSFSLGAGLYSLRDCSIVEATGVVPQANGERLGYVLRHSVAFPSVPDLAPFGVVRAHVASWAIYRESGPGMVQCFVKSFQDLGAGTWKTVGLKSVCDRALALCKFGACAEAKRLARVLLRPDGFVPRRPPSSADSDADDCAVCHAPFTASLLGSSARACGVCRLAVCAHCLHKKTVYIADDDAQRVAVQQLRVCDGCVRAARQPASAHLQIEQLLARDDAMFHTGGLLKPSLDPYPFSASLTDSDGSSDGYA